MKSTLPADHEPEHSSRQAGQKKPPSPSLKTMIWQGIRSDTSRAWYVIRNTRFREVMRRDPGEALGAIVAYVNLIPDGITEPGS